MSISFFFKFRTFTVYVSFFIFSIQLNVNKIYLWLDSNCGPLVLEATAPPAEPHYEFKLSKCGHDALDHFVDK